MNQKMFLFDPRDKILNRVKIGRWEMKSMRDSTNLPYTLLDFSNKQGTDLSPLQLDKSDPKITQ
jgi:hypothetical protein